MKAINAHAGQRILDCVVLYSAEIPENLRRRYARAHVKPVENDIQTLADLGVKVVTADLVGQAGMARNVRHQPDLLAKVVMDLAARSRAFQVKQEMLAQQSRRTGHTTRRA